MVQEDILNQLKVVVREVEPEIPDLPIMGEVVILSKVVQELHLQEVVVNREVVVKVALVVKVVNLALLELPEMVMPVNHNLVVEVVGELLGILVLELMLDRLDSQALKEVKELVLTH